MERFGAILGRARAARGPGAAHAARLRPAHAVPPRARDAAPPARPRRGAGRQRERHRRRRRDPLRRQRPPRRAGVAPRRRRRARAAHRHRRAVHRRSPPRRGRVARSRRSSRSTPRSRRSPAAPAPRGGAAAWRASSPRPRSRRGRGCGRSSPAADAPDVVVDAIDGRAVGTVVPARGRAALEPQAVDRVRAAAPSGRIVVDDGARRALVRRQPVAAPGRRARRSKARSTPTTRSRSSTPTGGAVRQGPGAVLAPRRCGRSPAARPPSSRRAARTRSSTATTSSSCPDRRSRAADRRARGRGHYVAWTRPCASDHVRHTSYTHSALVVDRRGESPRSRASTVDEEREEGEAGSLSAAAPPGDRRAARLAGDTASPLPNARRGRDDPRDSGRTARQAPGYTRRACPRLPPCPSSGGGRRPRPRGWRRRPPPEKNAALLAAADLLVERSGRAPRRQPARSSTPPRPAAWSAGPLDRLRLTDARIEAWPTGSATVAALPDPVGEVLDGWRRPNGLQIERVRVPLGVVAIIYENRPNVTSDAAGICLKSGNAALLRGSATRAAVEPGHRRRAARRRRPRPACPPTACSSSTTSATRPRSSSCSSPTTSTA